MCQYMNNFPSARLKQVLNGLRSRPRKAKPMTAKKTENAKVNTLKNVFNCECASNSWKVGRTLLGI